MFKYLEMVFGLVIFELYVEALFDPDLHLDGIIHLRVRGQGLHGQI